MPLGIQRIRHDREGRKPFEPCTVITRTRSYPALHIAPDIAFGRTGNEGSLRRNMPALIFQRLSQKLVQRISGSIPSRSDGAVAGSPSARIPANSS